MSGLIVDPKGEQAQLEQMLNKLNQASQAQQAAAATIGQFIMHGTLMLVASHIQAYLTNPETDSSALKGENLFGVIRESRRLCFAMLEELGQPPPKMEKDADGHIRFVFPDETEPGPAGLKTEV